MSCCHVYHICLPEDEGDLSKGYVGISEEPEERLRRHFCGKGSQAVLEEGLKVEELSYSLVFAGPRDVMLLIEKLLRPKKMAWNNTAGGGSPPNLTGKKWTAEQRAVIPASQTGKKHRLWKGYWEVDGVRHESLNLAAKALGCSKRTVRNRALSDKTPNWKFIPKEIK